MAGSFFVVLKMNLRTEIDKPTNRGPQLFTDFKRKVIFIIQRLKQ